MQCGRIWKTNMLMWFLSVEQLLELHRGQGMDIYWRDSNVCPTEEEYKQMVIQSENCWIEMCVQWKPEIFFFIVGFILVFFFGYRFLLIRLSWFASETGGLFGLAVRLMQLFSANKRYHLHLMTIECFASVHFHSPFAPK